ncbi:MAG: phosphate starvation-inducible protein PsiF [Proteobacteria bacterium]|nr:phosphate starvation-inducible protein PsiF [Pseudomonadota bacterium]
MKSFTMMLAAVAIAATSTGSFAAASKSKTTEKTPESIECSKQADAKGLHGKERVKFRAQCKKELKGKSSATTTPPPAADKSSTAAPAKTGN